MSAFTTSRELIAAIHAANIPVFLTADDRPALALQQKEPSLAKLLIVSPPRSGTHLASQLAEMMGFTLTDVHLCPDNMPDTLQDRRCLSPTASGKPRWQSYDLDLRRALDMLLPGQSLQGHVPYDGQFANYATDEARVIYVTRDVRNLVISGMRFIERLHDGGKLPPDNIDLSWCGSALSPEKKLIGYLKSYGLGIPDFLRSISPWRDHRGVFTLDFDLLTSGASADRVSHCADLGRFLSLDLAPEKLADLAQAAIKNGSPTWTGELSDYRQWWTPSVQWVANKIGFNEYFSEEAKRAPALPPYENFERWRLRLPA